MTTEPKSAEGAVAHTVARAMCERAESVPFEQLPSNKSDWTANGGQFGGRFRDVNEPMQCDYLDLAEAAIAAIDPANTIAQLQERVRIMQSAGDATIARYAERERGLEAALNASIAEHKQDRERLAARNHALVEALEKFCADQDFMPDYVAEALRAAQTGEGNG